ncbi:Segmentation protein cap'n'collar-like [Homarus americanus]|uniref:Segmentation protein cap'n'collar-like n=1 Tax=Homarus americanus TaxID=6706 RepID=A0A8J5K594_HOMAM|nr:Segmentation protein cap'n'collar-like [Homarus americanus]
MGKMGGSEDSPPAICQPQVRESFSFFTTFAKLIPEVSGSGVEHVQHNHTYHMSPEGPSGLTRPTARDKQRNRKNDHERTMSRDEKRARAMNLPISCEDIINLPMDEFNERISKYDLTEAQLSLIRDIRRRGKNKVAAQNCRKRKLDQILHLADEVKAIQNRKNELYNEYEYLNTERTRIKHKFSLLYHHVFQSLRDPDGNPYSQHDYSLQQSADGSVLLVPRSSPSHSMDPSTSNKPRGKGKDDPKQ